ncbi:spore coat protein GerQ [Lysinibacillus telephonicus]|nr:spore coat protein GerQ [Lysinibacillus telephonicus]
MTYYYWSPTGQQQYPTGQYPTGQFQQQVPPTTSGGTMQTGGVRNGTAALRGEESYIENILRLNRGKPGTFHFTVPEARGGNNTVSVRGVVEAAGRDHAIIRELQSNHRFLFPMIYFDYAEFDEELAYFNQAPR